MIDPATDSGALFEGKFKSKHGVLANNGRIDCVPWNATGVMVIDPQTDTLTSFGSFGDGGDKWGWAVLAPNGQVYGVPYCAGVVLAIDPGREGDTTFGVFDGDCKWFMGVLGDDGKICRAVPRT